MHPPAEPFAGLVVDKTADGNTVATLTTLHSEQLPAGDVLIEVSYSSLNYKDALAYGGHPGVVRALPHVPGIDCAGTVAESASSEFQAGDQVLVTGYGLGAEQWGGFARYVRVPADWVVAMPAELSARQAMILGTAGFTAAQAISAIVGHNIKPDHGPIAVTGATGGVGIWSVAILGKLGYQVTAVTGKPAQTDPLLAVGASKVVSRDAVHDTTDRPLLKSNWAAAIDTVGGVPLTTLIRSTQHRGCVAACGLVAGVDLPLTVHPFILRGVTLAGIDSAKCPREMRLEMWRKLANEWRVELPAELVHEATLAGVPAQVELMLAGETFGRTLVVPR